MREQNNNQCQAGPKLIFSCSGAADVANIADLAARQLSKEGLGKMYCLAGIGGQVQSILSETRKASLILAIDGCPIDCAKITLENSNFINFAHIRVTDLGLKKGKTSVNQESVELVMNKAKTLLDMSFGI